MKHNLILPLITDPLFFSFCERLSTDWGSLSLRYRTANNNGTFDGMSTAEHGELGLKQRSIGSVD